ncbi:MAG TPA: MerR family transcriptional regulator, partial [Acidimicrobiales bacterium]
MTERTTGGGLMTIGTFSRASLLSIKALRAYHEAGILVPARVDPVTGYRSYHAGQLTDAAVVQRLRALDVPLHRVREVVSARDPEVTRRVLADHAAAMQSRLDDVTRIVGELQAGVELPAVHTPVHVRDEPAAHTLAVRGAVTEDDFAEFLDGAYAELTALAERVGTPPVGPFGALYPPEISDDGPEPVEAFVPVAVPAPLPRDRGRVHVGE